ncbi:MAG: pyridoxamine 5'-phosphate oxidase family protein [Chloroflexota bacterium]
MREIADDITWLQSVLDQSIERAGPYLRSSFRMPDHSLNAGQLITLLEDTLEVALATVTAKGEPRVAPTAALFYRGRFYIPTLEASARVKQLRRSPAVSLTYYEGIDIAVIVHGRAGFVEPPDADFTDLYELQQETSGQNVRGWGENPLFIRVDPDVIYTFARIPESIAEHDAPSLE